MYLGNPYQMDFGDVYSTKGYYILDVPKMKYTFYENSVSPTHQKIKLSELVEIGKINKHVKDIFKNILACLSKEGTTVTSKT